MKEKISEISEKIDSLKKSIMESRNIARDIEEFLDEIAGIVQNLATIDAALGTFMVTSQDTLKRMEKFFGLSEGEEIEDFINRLENILTAAREKADEEGKKISVKDVVGIINDILNRNPDVQLRGRFFTLAEMLRDAEEKKLLDVEIALASSTPPHG
jgi:uncharacterized coiled-coil DUF342 family protein